MKSAMAKIMNDFSQFLSQALEFQDNKLTVLNGWVEFPGFSLRFDQHLISLPEPVKS
jgi:hypothetical protein